MGREGWHWVTDGGLETDLIFHHDVDLPEFAAYPSKVSRVIPVFVLQRRAG